MRTRALLALLAFALVSPALAGCVDVGDKTPGATPRGGDGVDPADTDAAPALSWGDPADATIRPGVQVISKTGQCTSNFVFTSPDGADVYLGLAAHCVEGLPMGEAMDIGPGVATGSLAYSSWATMADVEEQDALALEYNDFALVLIAPADRALVHPSVRHFGGPTAIADSSKMAAPAKVLTYGNSGLRAQQEPLSWHEGYVLDNPNAWTTTIYTATPGVPGDSGSAVMTGDGQALGILVTLTIAPTAGSNGVTSLDMALAYARTVGGVDARLATAELVDAGLLPGL